VLEENHRRQSYLTKEWENINNESNLVVGNPTMPQGYGPLTEFEEQARNIAQVLRTQALLGSAATKLSVKQQMPDARFIHIATHAVMDHETKSGLPGALALAPTDGLDDGWLTSEEILEMKLKAELVVLSCCETGKGDYTWDSVIGLSRCCLVAGVPSIIVSLWEVNVTPTSHLMTEFYEHLKSGVCKARALRQAIISTKKNYPSPNFWAAFTLIGTPL
jgi:CHAT domain-containing protein